MSDSLRDRIAAALEKHCPDQYEQDMGECPCGFKYKAISEHCRHQADAVIAELDGQLIDFALWLSEELRGEPLSRIDAESCLQEWKWLNDESRWLKDDDDD